MQFDSSNIEKKKTSTSLQQALEEFFGNPSEETLKKIQLKDPDVKYDKLKNLLIKVEALCRKEQSPIMIKLLLRCLFRLAKVCAERGIFKEAEDCLKRILEIEPGNKNALKALTDFETKRGRDAQAREYQLKYLEIAKNRTFRKYQQIQNLIADGQPESRHQAEKLIIELLQTLPAKVEQDLKFLILCAFYTLSPGHELWPILETETGITKEAISKVTRQKGKVRSLEETYLKTNSLWARPYSSTPVDRYAMRDVSDPEEVLKDKREAKT